MTIQENVKSRTKSRTRVLMTRDVVSMLTEWARSRLTTLNPIACEGPEIQLT